MPFIPNHISAVVLYGKKTCNRLVEILNYWQTILVDHAWDRYLFLCVTAENEDWQYPGEGEITPGTKTLIEKRIVRCMHIKLKQDQPDTWKMPTDYLTALQYRLNIGHVMVHCICDDLSEAPPVEAAVSLTESAVSFLGRGNVHCLYYLMLREHFKARQQQRQMALVLGQRQPNAIVYLLSNIANDGSRLHKFDLRRAAMCEILVASDGRRHYQQSGVYTLGYTSLNANDQELLSLRRDAIAAVLCGHYGTAITRPEAWDILTMKTGQHPNDYNDFAIASAVNAWVEGIAKKFVINPTDRELENLRLLSGIVTPGAEVGLQEACKKFYDVNMTARTDVALRKSVEKHISSVIGELRKSINVQGFPIALLHSMVDALKNTEKNVSNQLFVALPRKKLFQQKDEYLNQCARIVSDQVRTIYVSRAAAKVALCLADGFKRIEEIVEKVQKVDQFAPLMQEYKLLAAEMVNLQGKYPKYAAAIDATIQNGALNHFGKEWLQSAGAIYNEEFKVDGDVIRTLMETGVKTLHKQMPSGFNGTFMDALHCEFNTDNAMGSFLNKYLYNNMRHMFNCPYVTPRSADTDIMYYVDDDLQKMPWAAAHAANTIVANNDNIEKLIFIKLDKSLKWLAEEWQKENRYFGEHDAMTSGMAGSWIGDGISGATFDTPVKEVAPQAVERDDNPRNIRLTLNDDKYMLSWDWKADMKFVLVTVNGQQPPQTVSVGQYVLDGGLDVTSVIGYGRNEFVLIQNQSVYGKMDLCGKQYPVKYRFVPSNKNGVQLRLAGRIPPNASLLLGECTNKDTYCFYPVAARGLNGAANYDGLKLAGVYRLMVSPEDKFPVVNPVQDISL